MTHARNEDGFALIEVIVSAAVLAIVALAVLSGIDGATASTARERARAVASSLGEQDQERMRGYRFDELAAIPQQQDQVIQGVKYTIKSEATWVVDNGSVSAPCGTAGSKQAEYLRIVSTVTSTLVGTRIPAVRVESLVAAPVSGSLVVKVEPGQPTVPARVANVSGLTVQATADSDGRTLTARTNEQGCAIFRGAEPGDYNIRLNTSTYIDTKGNQVSEVETTVSAGIVNTVTMTYDKAIRISVDIKTLRPGTPFSTSAQTYPSKAVAVSDNAAERDVLRTFKPTSPSSSVTAQNLFPFAAAYSLFTGSCVSQSPVTVGQTNYFSQTNTLAAVIGDPNVFQPQSATVYQPAFNLRIKGDYSGTTNTAGKVRAFVWIQPVATNTCSEFRRKEMTVMTWPGGTWGTSPTATATGFVSSSADFDPGMAFGKYKVCLQDTANARWWGPYLYDNTSPNGQATTVELPDSSLSWSARNAAEPGACSS